MLEPDAGLRDVCGIDGRGGTCDVDSQSIASADLNWGTVQLQAHPPGARLHLHAAKV